MRQRIIEQIDSQQYARANDIAKKTTTLEAIYLANRSWSSITPEIIKNCFKIGGFVPKDTNNNQVQEEEKEEENAVLPSTGTTEKECND